MTIKTSLSSNSFYFGETFLFFHNYPSAMLRKCFPWRPCLMSGPFTHFFFGRKKILTASILLTVGCAPQLFWAKPGAQPGEFEVDASQCREALISNSGHQGTPKTLSLKFGISEDAMEQCLMAKGWILAEKP
jgi:hypothetical protein